MTQAQQTITPEDVDRYRQNYLVEMDGIALALLAIAGFLGNVAGYEIGPRVGMCMGQEHIGQGWHSGATVGVFSAVAGASASEPASALRRWAKPACTSATRPAGGAGAVRRSTTSAESTFGTGWKTVRGTLRRKRTSQES